VGQAAFLVYFLVYFFVSFSAKNPTTTTTMLGAAGKVRRVIPKLLVHGVGSSPRNQTVLYVGTYARAPYALTPPGELSASAASEEEALSSQLQDGKDESSTLAPSRPVAPMPLLQKDELVHIVREYVLCGGGGGGVPPWCLLLVVHYHHHHHHHYRCCCCCCC